MPTTEPTVSCDLSVLTDEQRERVEQLARTRFPEASEIRELPDGYALRFDEAAADLVVDLGEFVSLDRLCCPFLRHAVISEPGTGVSWLELTGGAGAKQAVASDLLALVPGVRPSSQ